MYGPFFNIDESAFSIAPNPKYLYLSKQHEEALAHLVYGVTRKGGFVCLTGDIGTGKTTICRCLFEQLPENTDIAFVINPKFSPMELLASICDELKLSYSSFQQPSIKEYVKKLNTYLIEAHARGRNTVLVIDEAQNLSVDALEHVRALTNLETNDQKLLQIILIGQPELKTLLADPELEQVNQRITARFHIGPLSLNETNHYINHRLLIAGAKQKIFSKENIKLIYKYTKGVPRRINILCDRILLGASTLGKNNISSQVIKQSAEEVFDITHSHNNLLPKALAASVFAVFVSGLAVFGYQNYPLDLQPIQNSLSVLTEKNNAPLTNSNEVTITKDNAKKDHKIDHTKAKENKNESVKEQVKSLVKQGEKQVVEKKTNFITKKQDKNDNVAKNRAIKSALPDAELASENLINNKSDSKQEIYLTSYGKGYKHLFRLWGVNFKSTDAIPCEHAVKNKLQCYKDWGDINKVISLNRPALLRSKEHEAGTSYIVVVSIEGDHAVVSENGDYQLVTIAEIESNWNGEFEMLWRPLKWGVTHISPGQQGKEVALLDKKLASYQGREPSTPHPFVYSQNLVDQVIAFQLARKLPSDGVVGPITQMHFNNSDTQSGELDTPFLIK